MIQFRYLRRVDFADTDLAGIVHFSNFFRYMEAAEVEFLRTRGLSVKMDRPEGVFGFPRVSATCDYSRPAYFGDLLDILVTLERLGTKSVTYAFEFTRGGETLARGKVTSVCCRVGIGNHLEATEIPDWYRTRLLAGESVEPAG